MANNRTGSIVEISQRYLDTEKQIGYIPRKQATPETYAALGFKCGLEIHQQLNTAQKLFCRCPAGLYQHNGEYDQEIIRHMRPTLSELGEYDGTALMEFKTRKNIIYRIKSETACTYDFDDTPPFPLNREALAQALEIALLLKTNIVGELHITRKQYLDGSIPTGFQRTGIIGIEGEIPLSQKKVRIIQLSIEEDACREVSDKGHWRVYTTDRLGIPLIEMVTYPEMLTPDEAAEAGHYLQYLARSSGKVRTGIGAGRQDVNVSITGGTRVEIKGVAHIKWIPELTHNEAFRQKALLQIKEILHKEIADLSAWKVSSTELSEELLKNVSTEKRVSGDTKIIAVNLPHFDGVLSFFTQPGQTFAEELSQRLKVIACLDHPNMVDSERTGDESLKEVFDKAARQLGAARGDSQVVIWGPAEDMKEAIETIEERCQLAFQGVPNETRKALADGTTIFERVLPGPDRMYPDTDSAPISIEEDLIQKCRKALAVPVDQRMAQLKDWSVPADTYDFIFRNNLMPLIEKLVEECGLSPVYSACLFGHTVKNLEGKGGAGRKFDYGRVFELCHFVVSKSLDKDIIKHLLPLVHMHPEMDLPSVLTISDYKSFTEEEVIARIPDLRQRFGGSNARSDQTAEIDWLMGKLRIVAVGNVSLNKSRKFVEEAVHHG